MDSSLVGIIFASLFGVIILFSFLAGVKRGFKKALFRLLWLVATGVLLWFVTPLVSNYLNSFDLTKYGITIDGQVVHKLSDVGVILLNSLGLEESITSSSAVQSFAQNFPTMILNIVLFVLLFFILKYLLWLVWAPIASKIFEKDKRAEQLYNKRVKELKRKGMPISEEDSQYVVPKKSKFRLLGGIVGLVCGLLISAVAFSPIVGLNAIYQNVSANIKTTNDDGEEVSFVNSQLDETTLEYANSYQNSIASTVLKYSGTEFMSGIIFNNMAVTEVEGQKVKLADEVSTGVKLYSRYVDIDNFLSDYKNATKEDLDKALVSFKELFYDMENSQLIYLLGDELLPILVEKYVIDNEDFQVEFNKIDIDEILRTAYKEYVKTNPLKVKEVQKQVESLVDIVQLFNNYNLAIPLIREEVATTEDFVQLVSTNVVGSNINSAETFSDVFVDKLYNISLLENQYTSIVNDVVEGVFKSLDIEFEANENISKNSLKDKFKIIFTNAIKLTKYYTSSQNLDFGENTKDALKALGKIIDCVGVRVDSEKEIISGSGMLTETSYNNLIDYLQQKANEAVKNIGDLSKVIAKLDNVNKESSWETELSVLSPLYEAIIKIKNDEENSISVDGVMDGTYNLKATGIGEALNTIIGDETILSLSSNSIVLDNESMREILSVMLDKIDSTSEINDYLNIKVGKKPATGEEDTRKTIKEKMLEAIYDTEKGTSVTDWSKELYDLVDVIVELNNTLIKNSSNLKALSGTDNDQLKNLGIALDKAKSDNTKLFVSSENIRALVEYFLDKQGFEETSQIYKILNNVNVGTLSVKDSLLNNIYNYTNGKSSINSWEDELVSLKSAFDGTLKETGDFKEKGEAIGTVLDNISKSNILSSDIVKSVVKYYLDEETKDFDFAKASYTNDKLNPIVIMKDNIDASNNIIYKDEIKNLIELTNVLNGTYSSDSNHSANWNKYNALGQKFDELTGLKTGSGDSSSKLITKGVVNCMLGYYISNSDLLSTGKDNLNSAIKAIPGDNNANLDYITSYQSEFNNLIDLAELLSEDTTALTVIGAKLDRIKLTSIIRFGLKGILKCYIDEKMPNNVDWNKANDYVTSAEIKNNIDKINIDKVNSSDVAVEDEILLREIIFANEFAYVDEFNKSTISLDSSGTLLNKLIGKEPMTTGGTYCYESKLLTKSVITIIIRSVMTSKITASGSIPEGAKDIILPKTGTGGLVDNVQYIEDYVMEFDYVNNLISAINKAATADIDNIAQQLDAINGWTTVDGETTQDETKKSKLFTETILLDLVGFYFDDQVGGAGWNKETKQYTTVSTDYKDYKDTLSSIRASITINTRFSALFSELKTLKEDIDKIKAINNIETFKSNSDVGSILDTIENMSAINGESVAKSLTMTLTNTLINSADGTNKTTYETKINEVLKDKGFEGHTKGDANYYSTLISALQAKLS